MIQKKVMVVLLSFVLVLSSCNMLSKPSLEGAKDLAKDGSLDEAIDMMEELIDTDENNYELYLSLADIYFDDEDYRKVDRTLEDLSEIIEDNFDEDDDDLIDAVDDLVDFAVDLKREGEPVGDWFVDFVESRDIADLDLNLSKVIDNSEEMNNTDKDDTDEPDKDNEDDKVDVMDGPNGYDLMSYTYGEVISTFGSPDSEDIGLNSMEILYNDEEYAFMFVLDGLNDSTPVGLVTVSGPDGRIHSDEPLIGVNFSVLSNDYGYADMSYYEKTVLNSGGAFAMTTDGTYEYLFFLDNSDNITDCFIQDSDFISASVYYAEDYLGYSLGEIKGMYGDLYYVEASEDGYIVMYFGLPYYFMFDSALDLTDDSLVTTVSLEGNGRTMYSDPLMTMSEDEFVNTYQYNYDSVDYDPSFGMAVVEAFGVSAIVIFDPGEYPNQVMVTNDLEQFGLTNGGSEEIEEFIPYYAFDYLGYTYGELKGFIGEPEYIDNTGPYRYLEYADVPYDFGFDMTGELVDSDYIYTVFIYFDEGGDIYEGFSYAYMTYDIFMAEEALYYSGIAWFEEDLRLEFEDDYAYYYLFYPDGEYPTYMLIETK